MALLLSLCGSSSSQKKEEKLHHLSDEPRPKRSLTKTKKERIMEEDPDVERVQRLVLEQRIIYKKALALKHYARDLDQRKND